MEVNVKVMSHPDLYPQDMNSRMERKEELMNLIRLINQLDKKSLDIIRKTPYSKCKALIKLRSSNTEDPIYQILKFIAERCPLGPGSGRGG